MQYSYLCFTFILLTISFKAPFTRSENFSCNSNDLRSLTSFSSSIDYGLDWNTSDSNCCTWIGVTCDNSTVSSKRVVRLELGSKRLRGIINESLAGLDQLSILNLSQNFLHGYLPARLLHLQNLEIIDSSNNDLVGPLPGGNNLSSIRYVDISRNNFNGSVDAALCESSSYIHTLNLGNNYFTGEVPANFGRCSSLQQLFLNDNHLSGNLPKSLWQLRNLRILHLQHNLVSGPLNDEIGKLSNLVELDISSNKFSGILPDVFERLKLENFLAGSNNFSGHLPMSLVNSPYIVILNLNNNTLNGPINLNCSAMVHLTSVDLGSNNFHGPLPDVISSCQRLTNLNLARNNLGGEVPFAFKNLQALRSLSLSNNSLVNISSALAILQHCRNLTSLFLSFNFHGEKMPRNVNFHFRNLRALAIPYCELTGSMPTWLSGSKMLQLLDLSWNRLYGTIPFWFHEFKYLFYMDLSNNSFTGEIPESLTELQGLINMKISSEGLSLGFPLFSFVADGAKLKYKGIWGFRPTLDLSYNKLTGTLWPGFGNLKELHVLKLKENHLSGTIPDSFSGMTSLEVLDLSYNDLSGEIPLSLEKLSFLSKFSIAYNQLQGDIPSGGQFLTFPPSSFEGNKGLRGQQLTPFQPQQAPHDVQLADEEMTIIGLQFGLGVMTGFLFTVTLCFASGWVFAKT
ncbi:phytosulfokine receptor 1-like [Populus nigra]|uniref:phytosulfokine receptor 1-like n=1 Tax=Populus nigra TaxID=3691 RepID=UPI002B276B81|nr:phytosulfokine receptor 1-like [Populus nigra]